MIRQICPTCKGNSYIDDGYVCKACQGTGLEPHRTLDIQEPQLGMQVDLTMNGIKYTGDLTQIRLDRPTDLSAFEMVLGLTVRPVK